MKSYLIGDGQADEVIQAASMKEAKELAAQWIKDGSWDSRCEVDVRVVEIDPSQTDGRDRRGAEVGDCVWITVEVGENPSEPECVEESHDWRGEGGLKDNPGVFSLGGTRMAYHSVCKHCGLNRREVTVGAQRNPGELDTVEYCRPE